MMIMITSLSGWTGSSINQGYNARKVNCGCLHIETSSLWAEFVNKNRCISVRLLFEEDILIILIIHIIVFYDQNISMIFYVKDGSHVRLWHPSCVYITAQRQYLQYKRCVHLWNNFPCIITLVSTKDARFLANLFAL